MDHAKEYAEQLIEAIASLDWSVDHPRCAIKAIQETVLRYTGDDMSEIDAIKVLGRLVERRFIKTRIDPPGETGKAIQGRKAKYFRVPENER